jgi:hypothetical protein
LRDELRTVALRECVALTKSEQLLEKTGALEMEAEKCRREVAEAEDEFAFFMWLYVKHEY